MKTMTKNDLWSLLQQGSLVHGAMPGPREKHSPWFVRAMLGVAGWLGALFLVGFVVAGLELTSEIGAYWVIGAITCGGAAAIFHVSRNGDFASQFGLAVAIAGEVLMLIGMEPWKGDSVTSVMFIIAIQQSILFVVMPNFLHRVWAAGTAALALCFAMGRLDLDALALPLLTAMLALAWLREFERPRRGDLMRAFGYGITLSAMFISYTNPGHWMDWRDHDGSSLDLGALRALAYAGTVLTVIVLVGAAMLLLQREKVTLTSGAGRAALALATVLALASIKAPGLAPASLILVLGFANGNRVLTGLGVVALLSYLSYFYYALHATLLEKSVLLMLTGVALLGLRYITQRWWPALNKGESTHA